MGSPEEAPSASAMCDQWNMHFQQTHCSALASLWRQQQLCDVQIQAATGETLGCHRIILASSCGFFRAMFCGAGQQMREGSAAMNDMVVELPYNGAQISALLAILYDHNIRVCSGNVAWLLDMASYLEVQPLLEACCSFLRSALSPETCVDVLLLAHHYHCNGLQAEGVQYLARHLSSLLLLPDSRQALCRLPQPLLRQLLSSEALEVEQEAELLCLISDWVSASPQERLLTLHQLLALLQLSLLPHEPPLSQQQLQACTSPAAATLAQQLHEAAMHCQQQQQQQQVQGQQQQQVQGQQQQQVQGQQQQQQQQQHCQRNDAGPGGVNQACPQGNQQQLHHQQMGMDSQILQQLQQQQHQGTHSSTETPAAAAASECSVQHPTASLHNAPGPSNSSNLVQQQQADRSLSTDMNNHTHTFNNASSSSGGAAGAAATAGVAAIGPDDAAAIGVAPSWLLGDDAGVNRGVGAVVLEAWPGRQRGYQPTRLLVAGGHDLSWRGLKAVELYDPRTDTWAPGPALPAALPFAGAGLLGRGELYVVGGGMYNSLLARLDAAASCWHSCEGPRTPRLHAAVAGSAGLLYVAGGRSQVNQVVAAVEVYDPTTACWSSLPDMQQPRYAHAVASLSGRVYAVGGQASKAIHRSVEMFDAGRGCWESLPAQLASERKYCAAAALGGRLLVLGGMNEARARLASMEGFDPREGRWTSLTSMQHARSSCGVAALGGRLYAVGGNAGDTAIHAAVEQYDPAAGKWRSCTALSCGRSGLLAAAV